MARKSGGFTEPQVRKLACPAGKKYGLFWDANTPGLGLRITDKGARSYVFEKRVHGGTVRVTVGDVRSWKLDDVRKEARRLATLVDRGVDPRIEAADKRAEAEAGRVAAQRAAMIVEGVWMDYVEASRERWGSRHYEDHLEAAHAGGEKKKRGKGLTKPGPLATLMPLKLSELTAETVAQWLRREVARRPTNAAKAFRLLRAFARWTADVREYKGIVPLDACSARIVRDIVPSPRAKDGDCLQREQLPAWFRGVRADAANRVLSAYLQTLLLTGARREELASLRWVDANFGTAPHLRLRDKVEGARTIPLTPYVASLLSKLPRRNEWVFSSTTAKDGRVVEPRSAHVTALEAAGLPHVTLHGLRRSFGTLAEWVEMPTGIVAQIQGHKPSAIAEKHYRRRPLDLLRMWHEKLEAWMLKEGHVSFQAPKDEVRAAA
jgi:integrase